MSDSSNTNRKSSQKKESTFQKVKFTISPEIQNLAVQINKKKVTPKKSPNKQKSLFDSESLEKRAEISKRNKNNCKLPESVSDYWISFKSEVRMRWPDADFPQDMTLKDKKQLKQNVSIYRPDQVLSMIRILVWDWEAVRSTCFPFQPNRPKPMIENLWRYANDLFAAIGVGVTDNREARLSKYYQRYVNNITSEESSKKKQVSMLDRFRKRREIS